VIVVIGQLRATNDVYVFVTVLPQVDSEPKNSRVRVTVEVTGVLAEHIVNSLPASRGIARAVAL